MRLLATNHSARVQLSCQTSVHWTSQASVRLLTGHDTNGLGSKKIPSFEMRPPDMPLSETKTTSLVQHLEKYPPENGMSLRWLKLIGAVLHVPYLEDVCKNCHPTTSCASAASCWHMVVLDSKDFQMVANHV